MPRGRSADPVGWSQQPEATMGASERGAGSGPGHGAPPGGLTAEAVVVVPEGGLPEAQGLWEGEGDERSSWKE